MLQKTVRRTLPGLLILALLMGACGDGGEEEGAAEPEEGTTEPEEGTTDEAPEGEAESEENDPIPLTVGVLSFASVTLPLSIVMEEEGIAEAHGIDLDVQGFGDTGAYYGALASGEVDLALAGPTILQNMRNDGVPIQALATGVKLHGGVYSTDPDIQTVEDLEGRTIAANQAISTFQFLAIYADTLGMDILEDVTVLDSDAAEAQAQLAADRVDAAMSWEPGASLLLQDIPEAEQIYDPQEAWLSHSGGLEGWEIVVTAREDWLDEHGQEGVDRVVAAFDETAEFIQSSPQEAGEVFEAETDFPGDVYADAIEQERLVHDIIPVWEGEVPEELQYMFEAAVEAGYVDELPDEDVLYAP